MDQALLDKIKKLLNKAQGTDNENEAQLFMNKVQELLIENGLEMAQVEEHDLKDRNSITKQELSLEEMHDKRHGKWLHHLVFGICNAYLCEGILSGSSFSKSGIGKLYVMGKQDNIQITLQMIEYLIGTIKKIEKKAWSEYEGRQLRGAYRRDFLFACQERVVDRLQEQKREMQYKDNKVTSLIRLNDKALEAFVQKEFPRVKPMKTTQQKFRDGTHDGYDAGNRVGLNNQIGGSSSTKHIG
jgi:hypothetical protein